jgi:hypothetical protein
VERKRLIAGAAALSVLALGGGGIAYAAGDAEEQATGPGIEEAKGAALDHTGGGRVTGTEIGDEEGYYEIEVIRGDGDRVDVHLDRDLDVLRASSDHEGQDDADRPDGS